MNRLCDRRGLGYPGAMGNFLVAMFDEIGARRRRLRAAMGDRGQAILGFLILGGLALGSVGLFVRAWMPAAAPWGFAIPVVFVLGFLLLDARRQSQVKSAAAPETVGPAHDWVVLWWSLGCALLGVAAFVIAWTAEPPPAPEEEIWTPPSGAVSVDMSP